MLMWNYFTKNKIPFTLLAFGAGGKTDLLLLGGGVMIKASDDIWTWEGDVKEGVMVCVEVDPAKGPPALAKLSCLDKLVLNAEGATLHGGKASVPLKAAELPKHMIEAADAIKGAVKSKRLIAEWMDGTIRAVIEPSVFKGTSGTQRISVNCEDGSVRELRAEIMGEALASKGLVKLYKNSDALFLVFVDEEECTIVIPSEEPLVEEKPVEEKPKKSKKADAIKIEVPPVDAPVIDKPVLAQDAPAEEVKKSEESVGDAVENTNTPSDESIKTKVPAHEPDPVIAALEAQFKDFSGKFYKTMNAIKSRKPEQSVDRKKMEALKAAVDGIAGKLGV